MDKLINKVKEITDDIIRFTPYRLVDVVHKQFKSKHTFTVFIDSMNGLTVSDCQLLNRRINEAMETCEYFDDSYILEVSSPGIDRPIRFDWQFKKNIGRKLEIVFFDPSGAEQKLTARLTDFRDDQAIVIVDTKNRKAAKEPVIIDLKNISSAKVLIDWS